MARAPKKPSPARMSVLSWLAADPARRVYGPMSGASGNQSRYGYAGGNGNEDIRKTTGDALAQEGLIVHEYDRYPLGYYRLGEAAAGIVAAAKMGI